MLPNRHHVTHDIDRPPDDVIYGLPWDHFHEKTEESNGHDIDRRTSLGAPASMCHGSLVLIAASGDAVTKC